LLDLPVTLVTTCVLGIFYVALSAAVSAERGRSKVGFGTGTDAHVALGAEHKAPRLLVAVRRHGHFAEYVPISILLIMLLEIRQANPMWLYALAGALVLARLMIAFGMGRAAPNVFRAGGNVVQWLMIVAASGYGLALVFMR
jgi:uncharacterized membrane protein YecN with MAPEG domain